MPRKEARRWHRLSHFSAPSLVSHPNNCTDCVGYPILPARIAEWDEELMYFIREAEDRYRHDRQHDRLPSDNGPRSPAKRTVAEESKKAILHRMQDFVADLFE